MLLFFAIAVAAAAQPAPDAPVETRAFLDRCEARGRDLWNRSLCVPVVLVDARSGAFRTTHAAPGPLPATRANTAFDWAGQRWVMALMPLPPEPSERDALLFHEAWHAIQGELGLPANDAVAGHLDDGIARYLLRLEWNALKRALGAPNREARAHVAQALAFRDRRLAGRSDAARQEADAMLHEGLAAYTGAAASGDARAVASRALRDAPAKPGLARSFAYASGPAWGLILDRWRPGWRADRSRRDLPDRLGLAAATIAHADRYGGTALLNGEVSASVMRAERLRTVLAATAPERALRLPLAKMNMDFDPNQVSTAPDGSTLYGRITLSDTWGRARREPRLADRPRLLGGVPALSGPARCARARAGMDGRGRHDRRPPAGSRSGVECGLDPPAP